MINFQKFLYIKEEAFGREERGLGVLRLKEYLVFVRDFPKMFTNFKVFLLIS